MELFQEDFDQLDSEDSAARSEARRSRSKTLPSRSRKTGRLRKTRRPAPKTSGRRRTAKRSRTSVVASEPSAPSRSRPEPLPIIPQPSLGAEDEEPTTDESEQRLEPPPPSASAPPGDDDDLFEYVI